MTVDIISANISRFLGFCYFTKSFQGTAAAAVAQSVKRPELRSLQEVQLN